MFGCDEYGHIALDCPHKISPSGTPYNHGRSHSMHWHIHNWKDRSHAYYGPTHRRHFSSSYSCPIPTITEAAVLEDTPYTLLPATKAAHATLQPKNAPITLHAKTPSGIAAPHPTLTTSPTGATHTTPENRACLAPATPTTQHKDLSPGKLSNTQDLQPP